MVDRDRAARLSVLSALADPVRLCVVDELANGDRSPGELAAISGVAGNLLAHHLNVLERAGVVRRVRSEADRRRTYVQIRREGFDDVLPAATPRVAPRVLFVCTHNSARSQLAEAVWRRRSVVPAASGGTHPAARVNPGAVEVARRHGLRLERARPTHVDAVLRPDDLVISVCDSADDELRRSGAEHLHWSVPDPVPVGTPEAFEQAYDDVASRVVRLADHLETRSRHGEP